MLVNVFDNTKKEVLSSAKKLIKVLDSSKKEAKQLLLKYVAFL